VRSQISTFGAQSAEYPHRGPLPAGEGEGGAQGAGEVVLRLTVADARRDIVERFTREIAALITAGPQGTTGYAEGRPVVREAFGYWPTLIDRALVRSEVKIFDVC
jgi:hypothetical protein